MRLKDKIVVITGAASGIGRGTAIRFAQEGAKLILGDRHAPRLGEVVSQLRAAGSVVASAVGDISDQSVAEALVDMAVATHGRIPQPGRARERTEEQKQERERQPLTVLERDGLKLSISAVQRCDLALIAHRDLAGATNIASRGSRGGDTFDLNGSKVMHRRAGEHLIERRIRVAR